jgi:hypothetical protein
LDTVDGSINLLTLSLGSGITILNAATATILVVVTPTQSAAIPVGTYQDSLRVRPATGEVFTEWSGIIRAARSPA